jgi:hypothetical protein
MKSIMLAKNLGDKPYKEYYVKTDISKAEAKKFASKEERVKSLFDDIDMHNQYVNSTTANVTARF